MRMKWHSRFLLTGFRPARRQRILRSLSALALLVVFAVITGSSAPEPAQDHHVMVTGEQSFPGTYTLKGYAITGTMDGGSVITGASADASGNSDMYIQKADAAGATAWKKTGKPLTFSGDSIQETPDGGYIVAGNTGDASRSGILLLKLDNEGTMVWSRTFQEGRPSQKTVVRVTPEGRYILAGSVQGVEPEYPSLWSGYLVMTDAGGSEQWSRLFKGAGNTSAGALALTADGGFVIAGSMERAQGTGAVAYIMKVNRTGGQEWVAAFDRNKVEQADAVLQTAGEGYLVTGTSCPLLGEPGDCSSFAARVGTEGTVLSRTDYTVGNPETGADLVRISDGTYFLVRQYRDATGRTSGGTILLTAIKESGEEQFTVPLTFSGPVQIRGSAAAPAGGLLFTGSVPRTDDPGRHDLFFARAAFEGEVATSPGVSRYSVTIRVRDARTDAALGGALIYLDGKKGGYASDTDGSFVISGIDTGVHSIRVTRTGYRERTELIEGEKTLPVYIRLNQSAAVPLEISGNPEDKLDIVFVPSATAYDCYKKEKITVATYTASRETFVRDVNRLVTDRFKNLDALASGPAGLPGDISTRFNFYYYWDPDDPADAFNGCAGSLPDLFWDYAPFTDTAIILYPDYRGYYTGAGCEPPGCANGLGPGSHVWIKAPATTGPILLHESGHGIFGLIDTYCGDTYYEENKPFPNVWESERSCTAQARESGWDQKGCRQIGQPGTGTGTLSCQKPFWRWDPEPDIMGTGAYKGTFGNASTARIRHITEAL